MVLGLKFWALPLNFPFKIPLPRRKSLFMKNYAKSKNYILKWLQGHVFFHCPKMSKIDILFLKSHGFFSNNSMVIEQLTWIDNQIVFQVLFVSSKILIPIKSCEQAKSGVIFEQPKKRIQRAIWILWTLGPLKRPILT